MLEHQQQHESKGQVRKWFQDRKQHTGVVLTWNGARTRGNCSLSRQANMESNGVSWAYFRDLSAHLCPTPWPSCAQRAIMS